jgi:hypothetical protein
MIRVRAEAAKNTKTVTEEQNRRSCLKSGKTVIASSVATKQSTDNKYFRLLRFARNDGLHGF